MFKRHQTRSKYRTEYPGSYEFDYKDPTTLSRFISEGGKITPARISKLSLYQQRKLSRAIKKARNLSLLPVGGFAYDNQQGPAEPVSPKPFALD